MIIMKLMGGLGNQLFQYAMGRQLALKHDTQLLLDLSYYKTNRGRKYDLEYFNIEAGIAGRIDLIKARLRRYHFVTEKDFDFDPAIENLPDNSHLTGYWQSEKYFKAIEETIRQDITLKNVPSKKYTDLLSKIREPNSVSIHIRRTDYFTIGLNVFTQCSLDYYHQAIDEIGKKTGQMELFIFSDDIDWAKQNLKTGFPITFVSDGILTNYEELMLMSSCKHNITANSSFSWWGAWLNSNHQKIVITPRQWFIDPARGKDMIPDSWVKL